jgi:hypothetical protein
MLTHLFGFIFGGWIDCHSGMLTHPYQVNILSKARSFCKHFAPKKGAMAQKPIVMEQLKQILQLHLQSVPIREIVRRTGVSRNSVKKYLKQHFSSEGGYSLFNDLVIKTIKYVNVLFGNSETCVYF